jgi:hypothetical protein
MTKRDKVTLTITGKRGDYVAADDAAQVWGFGQTPALAVQDWQRQIEEEAGWMAIEAPTFGKPLKRRMRRLQRVTRGRK